MGYLYVFTYLLSNGSGSSHGATLGTVVASTSLVTPRHDDMMMIIIVTTAGDVMASLLSAPRRR